MIPKDYIAEWRSVAPWTTDAQVEQDPVLSRALVELFTDADIAAALAFRGGTALYKLHIRPAARYSEDIDLVQVRPEPIGPAMDAIRARLDSWLGAPKRQLKEGRVSLIYRFESEDAPPLSLRLKIEINSREHFAHYGHVTLPFQVESRWFTGEAHLTTYSLNELYATKLRALYQRRKGRDLFDLWLALDRGLIDPAAVASCFARYMDHGKTPVSRAEFEANLAAKMEHPGFGPDVAPLLVPNLDFDAKLAMDRVSRELVERLPGPPLERREGAMTARGRPSWRRQQAEGILPSTSW